MKRRIYRFKPTKDEARIEVARVRMKGGDAKWRYNVTTGLYVVIIN